jgi:hypothetical protein
MDSTGNEGQVVEVLGVYDADGGVRGELAYAVGKVLGRAHCSLCDVTHGTVRRKRDWDAFVREMRVPVRVAHRNETGPEERAVTVGERLPLVLGRTREGHWQVLLDADRLDALDGSVPAFGSALRDALAAARTDGRPG